ncbi:LLM class flavin-dependent oxidoreductase [Streptomyces justiciae]|uniref:LLM class flavin-dependent oxidoreductase n=1 Tax=Streptomyces justiciae TaxID=2780140 RepID=UPI0021198B3B|nr:LLM class flavin-dependent oxidoreductase [Streptomyces justiciae]MCW8379691.1 LLM class flavin-dependent oxidoreductase [Streptomyces justiciae]
MQVELFTPVIYYGEVDRNNLWPVAPRWYDSEQGVRSFRFAFEQMEAGHEAGFDSLNFAEHHYSTQMNPTPHLLAAALGQRLPDARIGILGTDLPLHNPILVAEQYAVLDNLLEGRLHFALLRGTPNEYMTYGTNPSESRERFAEAVELIIRAFTEPEPFGWEGRYYRYRNIALFPQPVQKPHPRILLSANSPSSARFAGRMRCDAGISFMVPEKCAPVVAAYRQGAAEAGWTPTADNILYRQVAYVAETDAQAWKDIGGEVPSVLGMFANSNPDLSVATLDAVMGMAGLPKGAAMDPALAPVMAPSWIGSPETVLESVREAERHIGMGRLELVLAGMPGAEVPHDKVLRTIKLLGQEVLPVLRSTVPAAH